jgi:hypothetical protein
MKSASICPTERAGSQPAQHPPRRWASVAGSAQRDTWARLKSKPVIKSEWKFCIWQVHASIQLLKRSFYCGKHPFSEVCTGIPEQRDLAELEPVRLDGKPNVP